MLFLAIQLKSKWHTVPAGSNGYFMATNKPPPLVESLLITQHPWPKLCAYVMSCNPHALAHYMDLISRPECALVKSKLGN